MSETLLLPKTGRFLSGSETVSVPGTALIAIPTISRTNRTTDAATTPGRCTNLDYCSIGMQRGLVRVPVSRPFVCPECGGRLRPPGLRTRRRASLLPMARLAVLAVGMAAALALGYLAGQAQPSVAQALAQARHAAADQLAPAPGLPQPSTAPSPAPARATTEPALPTIVTYRPVAARGRPAEQVSPSTRLLHETRTGEVVVDCTLAALVTQPVCKLAATRGTDAFSAAALAWLQQLRIQYAPNPDSRSPVLPDHRWRLVVEDFSGQEKRAAP